MSTKQKNSGGAVPTKASKIVAGDAMLFAGDIPVVVTEVHVEGDDAVRVFFGEGSVGLVLGVDQEVAIVKASP